MNDWNEAEQRVEKAHELFEQRRWNEALEELRAAISINPYNSSWFFNIGLTLDELGRYDEALTAYQQAVDIDPDDLQALNHLGVDQCRVGRFQDALKCFEKVESADPSFEPAYCNRIIAYSELGEHEKAEEMFYLARLYKDQCPHCYYNIGCSLAARGLYDKAIFCWQRTLDLDEEHPEVHVRIAEALWSKGSLEQARRHYLIGLRHNPGAMQTLLDLGDLLLEMGLATEAGEKFRRAMEQSPDHPSGYFCHGNWLMQAMRDEEAIADFKKVLKLDPTYPGAHLKLAQLYHRKGNPVHTRRHLRSELLLHPEEPQVLADLSDLLLDVGDNRSAAACLKRLTKLRPDDNAAWQNLAVAQFAQQRYADGIASCLEALRCDPRNLVTLFNLALAHEHLAEFDRALVYVRRGVAHSPSDLSLQRLEFRIRALKLKARIKALLHL